MSPFVQQQWDGLFDDIQREHDIREIRAFVDSWIAAAKSWEEACGQWKRRSEAAEARCLSAEHQVMGGFALQSALEAFVLRCYRGHPLIQDKALQRRIYDAGVRAGSIENSYSAAREAGRTFAMPREVIQPLEEARADHLHMDESLLAAQNRILDLEREALAKLGVEAAMQRVIRDCAHHMAQAAAFRAQLEQVDPENPLVTDGDLRKRIADAAYDQLCENKGADWSVVGEVGRTFAIRGRPADTTRLGPEDLLQDIDEDPRDEYLARRDIGADVDYKAAADIESIVGGAHAEAISARPI